MTNQKPKIERFTSPKGVAKYPKLIKPDTKFKAEGEYSVILILPEAEATDLCNLIDQKIEESFAEQLAAAKPQDKAKIKKADPPYAPEYDEEGNLTGNILFKFRSKASGEKDGEKWERKIKLFDAKGIELKDIKSVWGGSVIKVNFTPSLYFIPKSKEAGVTLRLNVVQILELVQGTQSASDYGFGTEEGYSSESNGSDLDEMFPEGGGVPSSQPDANEDF